MNLATLDVSKDQAREALQYYRKDMRAGLDPKEYESIRRGYQRVMKGQQLIELSKVIAAGGADEKHRPRLAVMQASERFCRVEATSRGAVRFFTGRWRDNSPRRNIRFPANTLPQWNGGVYAEVGGQSVLPIIPPQLLPKGHLSRYAILWEASWEDAPVDPALLQHLGGDLWAVLAVWDLTDLERAVLRGRANA